MSTIKEAAERLRPKLQTDKTLVFGNQYEYDTTALAAAYLSEHRADDEVEIDKTWLVQVGGKTEWHPDKITFWREGALDVGLWNVDDGWKAMLILTPHAANCIVRGLKTRADVRRLAAALGIGLKE